MGGVFYAGIVTVGGLSVQRHFSLTDRLSPNASAARLDLAHLTQHLQCKNDLNPSRSRARGHDQRGMATMLAHSDVHLEDLDRGRMAGGCGDPLVARDQRSL
jgi:hypothetical protein